MQESEYPPSDSDLSDVKSLTLDDVLELHYRLRLFPLATPAHAQNIEPGEQ